MPTGYTADIPKGIDFKTYAMNCARSFGACVTLRDEEGGGEVIPDEFTPSDYHAKQAQDARWRLSVLLAMTPEQRESAAAKWWDDAETSRQIRIAEKRKTRAAYEAMLAKVIAWKAPTPEHTSLRDFMRSQIVESIDFDCGEEFVSEPTARITGDEWAAREAAALNRSIGYHEQEHADEVRRAAERTEWVRALRASLGA